MLKKSISILLTLVLSLSIVASYPIKAGAKSPDIKGKKEYKSKKKIKDGKLDITIEENNKDDVKLTVINNEAQYSVSSTIERKNKKVHISNVSKQLNQDEVVSEYTFDEETNTIDGLPPIQYEVDPGHEGGGYYYTYDNLNYIAENPFNPDIQEAIPYSHVNFYTYNGGYGISKNVTTCKSGTLFDNVQISATTVDGLQGYSGAALGAILGGILEAKLTKKLTATIIGSAVGAVVGAIIVDSVVNKLRDERGCIWVRIDKDPEVTVSYVSDGMGHYRPVTYYTYKTIMVGPYWKTNCMIAG